MKVLKYFILKQKSVYAPDGKISYVSESTFADILEGKSELAAEAEGWFIGDDASTTYEEGELI